MRYKIINNKGVTAFDHHEKNLSAAKHYVDTHRNCVIYDNVLKKIVYPIKKTKTGGQ